MKQVKTISAGPNLWQDLEAQPHALEIERRLENSAVQNLRKIKKLGVSAGRSKENKKPEVPWQFGLPDVSK